MTSLQTLLLRIKGGNIATKKWKNIIESRLYQTIFSGCANRYESEVAEFYPIIRKRRYKNLLKGCSFLANSKFGQCLLK